MVSIASKLPAEIRLFLLVVPAVMVGLGIQKVYVYFENPKPIEISIEQLISNPPRAKWVRVTGGRIDLMNAASSEAGFKKKIDKVYVPVHPEGKDQSVVSVLLLSTDPALIEVARQMHALDEAKDGEVKAAQIAIDNAREIFKQRPFEGLIQSGLDRDDRAIFQLRKALSYIAKEPVIIEEGKKPTLIGGLVILLLAFLAAVGIISTPRSKKESPPPLPPSLPKG